MKRHIFITLLLISYGFVSKAQSSDSVKVQSAFSKKANFEFALAKADTVTLQIFNRWGQTVGDLLKKTAMPKGMYTITWKPDSLQPAGTYVYTFDKKQFTQQGLITYVP